MGASSARRSHGGISLSSPTASWPPPGSADLDLDAISTPRPAGCVASASPPGFGSGFRLGFGFELRFGFGFRFGFGLGFGFGFG